MITLCLRPQDELGQQVPWCYRLASRTLVADTPLAALEVFERCPPPVADRPVAAPRLEQAEATLVYAGPGWIGGRFRGVRCSRDGAGYWLEIARVGSFRVGADGNGIAYFPTEAPVAETVVTEATLGPAMMLALAVQGVCCLHGSAVIAGKEAVAFVGKSGAGKSTLAAFLGDDPRVSWRRLADDVVPTEDSTTCPAVLPHFPQLKLRPEQQACLQEPEKLPLRAVYRLAEASPGQDRVSIQHLSPRDATLTLMAHTVAARLFDSRLLPWHMAFCTGLARQLRVRVLSYPRRLERLPEVSRALVADLQDVDTPV